MPAPKSVAKKRASRGGKPRPLVRKKLWIFDFDNTIARLEPEVDWAGGRRELEPMLRELGVPEDLFEKFPRGNLPLYNATRSRLLELIGNRSSGFNTVRVRSILRRASKMIEKYEMAGVDRAAPLEGAIDLLKRLKKKGATLAIVTSNSSRTIRRWFAVHHLSRLIDVIVGRDSLLGLKPSPEMISRALELCAVRGNHQLLSAMRIPTIAPRRPWASSSLVSRLSRICATISPRRGRGEYLLRPPPSASTSICSNPPVVATGKDAEARSSDRS